MKLRWTPLRAPFPSMQMWRAQDGIISYVITRDTGCRPDDTFYGRYSVSAKMAGTATSDLGQYDTFDEAQAAALASRRV